MVHETISTSIIIKNTLIQVVNLLIFFYLFYYFLAGPVIKAAEKRKDVLKQFKQADEILAKKLKEADEQKKNILNEALDLKGKILYQAKEEAEQIKHGIIEEAKKERDSILARAQAEIQFEKEKLKEDWEESVKQTVLLIYQKLIGSEDEVIKKYVNNIKDYKI